MAIYQIISLVGTNALRLGFGLWLVECRTDGRVIGGGEID